MRWLALALAVALVLWWVLRKEQPSPTQSVSQPQQTSDAPELVGVAPAAPDAVAGGGRTGESTTAQGPSIETIFAFEVRDYRNVAVDAVEVRIEREVFPEREDAGSDPSSAGWRVLGTSSTDERGFTAIRATVDRDDSKRDGPNLRIRLTPPAEREDLSETWRLWMPKDRTVFEFQRSHFVAGRVIGSDGEPSAGAQVFAGSLPDDPDIVFFDPAWRRTRADAAGKFRFTGIPTTRSYRVHVWAVAAGAEPPRVTIDITNAQDVSLDSRDTELRLR